MVTRINTAAGGTAGQVVTAANSGGGSGDAFNTVLNDNNYITFDDSLGQLAYRITNPMPYQNGDQALIWELGTSTTIAGSVVFRVAALPPGGLSLVAMGTSDSQVVALLSDSGQILVYDQLAYFVTTTALVRAQTWYRLAWSLTFGSAGNFTVNLYNGPYTTTPVVSLSGARAWAFASNNGHVEFGSAWDVGTLWLDDLQLNNVGVMPGPVGQPASQPALAVPPVGVGVSVSANPPPTNDSFLAAQQITITTDGGTYSTTVNTAGYSREAAEPDGTPYGGAAENSAWWWYRPTNSGTVTIDTIGTPYDTLLHVFTGTAITALTVAAADDDGGGGVVSKVSLAVTAGTRYYIRASSYSAGYSGALKLRVVGPATVTAPVVAPAISTIVRLLATVRDNLIAPPIEIRASVPATAANAVIAPPVFVRPRIGVAVSPGRQLSAAPVAVQADMPTPAVNAVEAAPVDAGAHIEAPAVLRRGPDDGRDTITVTWTVTNDTPEPHVWFIDPGRGQPGTDVTVFGQGFPLSTGRVTVADVPATVRSWDLISATDAATTDARALNLETVDPEHFEVVITVPEVEEPGGPLVVEGGI